ncbi:nitroreductase family protein [Pseudomonas aeruginosa]|uniref:nitroreductase family protein n=1 Tax=Pseudomonas aeruginosa TaxID=287 RepID=UPI0018C8C8BF|nr:nitroreductase family protein [Pseudomonas aeruginosa]
MDWIDLKSPSPKPEPEAYAPFTWPAGRYRALEAPAAADVSSKIDPALEALGLLDCRRSRRSFTRLTPEELAALLWFSARTQATANSDLGFELEQRPSPSAGAIHPIHLLVLIPDDTEWSRYDSRANALVEVPGSSEILHELTVQMESMMLAPEATKALLIAEPGKTQAKYLNHESLVWRDAGALLATMGIVAEALNLSYCPLGITGEPWVGKLSSAVNLVGVGAALVGGRAT